MTTDTQATGSESSELNVDTAADAFLSLLNGPQSEETEEVKAEPEKAEAEAEAEPVEEAEEVDDTPITIKIDGKEVEISKAELADYYKNGLRQADYTRKTMEVSEQRKAAEAERQAAIQERATYGQNLAKMAAQLEGALEEQSRIDWDALLQSDPVEYLKQQSLAQKRQAALQQNLQQQGLVAEQIKAEQQKAFVQSLQDQHEQLIAKVPEWKDAKKASADKAEIAKYLIEQGYDKQSVENVADAKAVVLARKAMLYDQMISKASAAAKKVSNLPTKAERPGSGKAGLDQRSSAFQKLSKSGSVEDAAAVFRSFI